MRNLSRGKLCSPVISSCCFNIKIMILFLGENILITVGLIISRTVKYLKRS